MVLHIHVSGRQKWSELGREEQKHTLTDTSGQTPFDNRFSVFAGRGEATINCRCRPVLTLIAGRQDVSSVTSGPPTPYTVRPRRAGTFLTARRHAGTSRPKGLPPPPPPPPPPQPRKISPSLWVRSCPAAGSRPDYEPRAAAVAAERRPLRGHGELTPANAPVGRGRVFNIPSGQPILDWPSCRHIDVTRRQQITVDVTRSAT